MMDHQSTPAEPTLAEPTSVEQLPAETSQDSGSSQPAPSMLRWRQPSSDSVARADWRSWFFELPAPNRTLMTLGSLFIGLGVLQMALPPVVRGAAIALRPYSEGGRQDHCVSNLKSLGLAVMQYSQDYDEYYVPVRFVSWKSNGSTGSSRENFLQANDWPQVLQPYLPRDRDMLCQNSRNSFDELTGNSYGYNPVFAQVKAEEITNPVGMLLMADRGTQHPLYLLPPQLPWTQGNTTIMEGTALQEQSNVAFRHNAPQPTQSGEGVTTTPYSNDARSAMMLYADGHVKRRVIDTGASGITETNGTGGTTANAELNDITLWGGDLVSKAAQAQIQVAYTSLNRINGQLESGTLKTLQSGQKQGVQTQEVTAAQAVLPDLLAQWTANREGRQLHTNPEDQTLQELNYNPEIEALGWRTALLWQRAGSPTFLQQLQETQSRQMNAELQVIQKGGWREYEGSGVVLSVPETWNVSEEMSSQYVSTYARSHLPGLWVMLEKGERSQIARRAPVDWSGMEKDYRNRYGSKYQRVRIGTGTLGGERAGLWEFTVQNEDGPTLRKLYLGVSHPWQSYVLVCVAPANDYTKWQSTFEKVRASFRFNPIAE